MVKLTDRSEKLMHQPAIKVHCEDLEVMYVGRKPPMDYVLGIMSSLAGSDAKEVTLKARGQAISTAVDGGNLFFYAFWV